MPEFELFFVCIDEEGFALKTAKGSLRFIQGMLTEWIGMCQKCAFPITSAQIVPWRDD